MRTSAPTVVIFALSTMAVTATAGRAAARQQAPSPTNGWTKTMPADRGLAPEPLATPHRRAAMCSTLQSVTKPVTSALIGIARGPGEIAGSDAKLVSFLDGYDLSRVDGRLRTATLHDLLDRGYCYQWWRLDRGGVDAWAGLGYGGQFLIVIPAPRIAGVVNSWNVFGQTVQPIRMPFVDALVVSAQRRPGG